jgi:hypothetical protein
MKPKPSSMQVASAVDEATWCILCISAVLIGNVVWFLPSLPEFGKLAYTATSGLFAMLASAAVARRSFLRVTK